MKTRTTLLAGALMAMCAAMPLLSGCDSTRESLASAIRPASADEVAGALRQQIAQGKYAEASADGASYLKDKQDARGIVAWETAKASAQAGKADDAIRFAEMAVKGGALQAVDLMGEPLLEPVRTDLRLVVLAAGGQQGASAGELSVTAPAAIGAQAPVSAEAGVKASAGDVSVALPD